MKKKKNENKMKRQCFSLMELMIVLLILGMLAALITPNLMKKAEKAKHNSAKIQIKLLGNAVKDYYLDMDEYPDSLDDLIKDPNDPKWTGPYLDPPQIPKDPWNEPYHYDYPGQHGAFDIYSYGADKTPGGDQFNADIGSWE